MLLFYGSIKYFPLSISACDDKKTQSGKGFTKHTDPMYYEKGEANMPEPT